MTAKAKNKVKKKAGPKLCCDCDGRSVLVDPCVFLSNGRDTISGQYRGDCAGCGKKWDLFWELDDSESKKES